MTEQIIISPIEGRFTGKSRLQETIRGIFINKTLSAALELELFSLLAKAPLTGEEIRSQLNLPGRGVHDFLDALTSLGLLNREGHGEGSRYSNTEEGATFLVKDSPYYIGGWFSDKMKVFEQSWGELAEALKTGKPQRQDIKESGKALFELNYDSKQKTGEFIVSMNVGQLGSFNSFVRRFDFSRYHTLCDIGGGNGLLTVLAAQQCSHLECFTFDLPSLAPFAGRKIEEAGLSGRITIVEGDFFKDDFPRADIITMGNILHDWSLEQKKLLIGKAFAALPEGGALVVLESIIDNERKKNTTGLLMSLHMLLLTEGGFDFTAAEFETWAREAGFKKIVPLPLQSDSNALIAYK